MQSNYVANQSLRFQVLSREQQQELHLATLEVLESVGVNVFNEEALQLYRKAGAFVEGNRVRIPTRLVEWAVRTAPSRVVLCDRNGERKLFLEGNKTYFGPGPTNPFILDPDTGERRKVTKADVAKVATIVDYLPNVDFVMSLAMISDQTEVLADVHEVEAMLLNTTKPIVGWAFDVDGYETIIEMCIAVAGNLEELQKNPFICLYSEPTTPLLHSDAAMGKLLYMADKNLPLIYTPAPAAGSTAPATMAGALIVDLAECLSGLVAAQLKREGAPYITGGVISNMDMATTQYCYGSPEFNILHAALTELIHYNNLPSFGTAGCTDSKVLDQQAAAEVALNILMAALSGANLVHDLGFMESGISGSMELIVLDDEIVGMVKRMLRGIEVNEETKALDAIKNVGPGGHFLGEEHTFKHFKNEFWFPTLFNRQRFQQWSAEGGLTLGERLNQKVKQILAEHKPEPLPETVVAKIKAAVAAAEARAAGKRKG